MRKLVIVIILIVVAGGWVVREFSREMTTAEAYPGPWKESSHQESTTTEIRNALAGQNVRNCSRYKYRKHFDHPSEYLVHCTADGSSWRAYIVLLSAYKVMGPYPPDSSLD
uniref:Uncharacterized protein n=1 Tax=Cyanothece sp. (strain PCC 7425 / ATCC 29141) TaxID=395961 RepID=B8HNM3_CYAP4